MQWSNEYPLLGIDFDGVLFHMPKWEGAHVISGKPIRGITGVLRGYMEHFQICILSSRNAQHGGIRAMVEALIEQRMHPLEFAWMQILSAVREWPDDYRWARDMTHRHGPSEIDRAIQFPLSKPPLFMLIDDRCHRFEGTWPSPEALKSFKPWDKPGE